MTDETLKPSQSNDEALLTDYTIGWDPRTTMNEARLKELETQYNAPELDSWRVDTMEAGFVFEDDFGPLHAAYYYTIPGLGFKFTNYYLMGPL